MNNTALNALAGMARIVMLLLLLGPWANAAHASMRPDCPMRVNPSSAPCPSLDTRAAGHPGCMQASMNAAAPCLTPEQRAPAKEQLQSAAVPGWFVPMAQIAALARRPRPSMQRRRRFEVDAATRRSRYCTAAPSVSLSVIRQRAAPIGRNQPTTVAPRGAKFALMATSRSREESRNEMRFENDA